MSFIKDLETTHSVFAVSHLNEYYNSSVLKRAKILH